VCHLSVDFGDRVLAVGPHPVSLATVVAGSTGQVAAGKHAVGSLTTRRAPTQELSGGLDVVGELLPAPRERGRQLRLDRPRDLVEPARQPRPSALPSNIAAQDKALGWSR